ncbi:hypothetical protein ACOZE3_20605 [Streptomyces cinereoruber]|uniref:hypothetical protein n=1 Tax=Streptomyces cinereoruber TaxID=67260 RepID=UPI003BF5273F
MSAGLRALPVLAHLRTGYTYAQLSAGYGGGTTTIYRYAAEAVEKPRRSGRGRRRGRPGSLYEQDSSVQQL